MKKIAFIGAYDKTDFLLYVSKIITALGKKVLVVDTTITQKAKYVVPVIHPTSSYITEYEDMDVAVGFSDLDEIRGYLGLASEDEFEYDYCMLDIDTYAGYNNYNAGEAIKKYFVTSFDVYSLKKGLEAISGVEEKITLTKVLFSKNFLREEDEYLEFLAMNYNIEWEKEHIDFPFDSGEQNAIIENQRTSKLNFRNLSSTYKAALQQIAEGILEQEGIGSGEIGRTVRKIEKGA
ncbi:MAG: hypothetical protein ACI4VN_01045 [Clostridia bacterium]|nr:hypothetical protein [Clostridia bacterium]